MTPAKHEAQFTSPQVCAAADITPATLKNWVSRQPQVVLLSKEERERAGKGGTLFFSFNRVMQIALTAVLVKQGLQPRHAALIAAGFTDVGQGETPAAPERLPGDLFADGFTYLVAYAGDENAVGHCIKVAPKMPAPSLLRGGPPRSAAILVADVNEVYGRVAAALGWKD